MRQITMQKRHFVFVADIVKQARQHMSAKDRAAFDASTVKPAIAQLRHDNPSFNRDTFERACGMEG
jgi:hypothetical protein